MVNSNVLLLRCRNGNVFSLLVLIFVLLHKLIQVLFSYCSHSSSSSNSSSKSEPTEVTPNTLINTFPRAPSTSDSIRLKCREMISNALQAGGMPVVVIVTLTHLQHRKSVIVVGYGWLYLQYFPNIFVHSLTFLFVLFFLPDDYIAIGADCDELGAQVEEYILYTE